MLERLSNDEIMREYVLGNIIRYNHRRKLQNESVAEHAFFVSIFSLKVMSHLELTAEEQRQVLVCAALHDVAESMTSDIPHDVKVRYERVRNCLQEVEDDYIKDFWPFYQLSIDKQPEIVYNIIKVSDAYSVLQYCTNERELGSKSKELSLIEEDAHTRITRYTNMINDLMLKRRMEDKTNAEK